MLESLNYSFRNPKNIIWVIYRIKQLRNYKKTMGSSEDKQRWRARLGILRLKSAVREHRLAPCDSTAGISSAITGSSYEQIKTYRRQIRSLLCSRNSMLFLRNINIKPVRVWNAAYNAAYFTLSHLFPKCAPRIPRDLWHSSQRIRG